MLPTTHAKRQKQRILRPLPVRQQIAHRKSRPLQSHRRRVLQKSQRVITRPAQRIKRRRNQLPRATLFLQGLELVTNFFECLLHFNLILSNKFKFATQRLFFNQILFWRLWCGRFSGSCACFSSCVVFGKTSIFLTSCCAWTLFVLGTYLYADLFIAVIAGPTFAVFSARGI